jgi:hypothetical protein
VRGVLPVRSATSAATQRAQQISRARPSVKQPAELAQPPAAAAAGAAAPKAEPSAAKQQSAKRRSAEGAQQGAPAHKRPKTGIVVRVAGRPAGGGPPAVPPVVAAAGGGSPVARSPAAGAGQLGVHMYVAAPCVYWRGRRPAQFVT